MWCGTCGNECGRKINDRHVSSRVMWAMAYLAMGSRLAQGAGAAVECGNLGRQTTIWLRCEPSTPPPLVVWCPLFCAEVGLATSIDPLPKNNAVPDSSAGQPSRDLKYSPYSVERACYEPFPSAMHGAGSTAGHPRKPGESPRFVAC